MRASCNEAHTQEHTQHTHSTNKNKNNNNNENNKNNEHNKNGKDQNRVFQYDENRPEHSHGILDFVFTKLGHEAFSPTTPSFSTSISTSSRKNNSTPISILKGMKIRYTFYQTFFSFFLFCFLEFFLFSNNHSNLLLY